MPMSFRCNLIPWCWLYDFTTGAKAQQLQSARSCLKYIHCCDCVWASVSLRCVWKNDSIMNGVRVLPRPSPLDHRMVFLDETFLLRMSRHVSRAIGVEEKHIGSELPEILKIVWDFVIRSPRFDVSLRFGLFDVVSLDLVHPGLKNEFHYVFRLSMTSFSSLRTRSVNFIMVSTFSIFSFLSCKALPAILHLQSIICDGGSLVPRDHGLNCMIQDIWRMSIKCHTSSCDVWWLSMIRVIVIYNDWVWYI